ncbi:Protein CcdB [Saliniradius amylolyticus]|uniref:Protein CcdB n=1 Tax=Saliniradius amylolyticus TaxID=2183582 RepID=A0A2S2E093_9ALTE|nr:response regulator [Saliniradius amylolyticus]AWL11046.1 Protein CcdB [Saliniradius amylolyticus]
MSTSVLICDDSKFARQQMARAIPQGWDVSLSFAENGQQALEAIKAGKADVTFLDLNMPVMDGYETMQQIRQQDLPTMVLVVSGDVQPEARKRMRELGALDFIAKPVDSGKLNALLRDYGLYDGLGKTRSVSTNTQATSDSEKLDIYREMANVAMGQAGDKLARLLGEFIHLPVPNVNVIAASELRMAVAEIQDRAYVSATSQGFVSEGVGGEALVIFDDADFSRILKLLRYPENDESEGLELEALMDVSNILIGACVNALSEQLGIVFSRNHPSLLGRHCNLDQLLTRNVSRWNEIVAIEIGYTIQSQNIHFDLLLLFPRHAIDGMVSYLTGDRQ